MKTIFSTLIFVLTITMSLSSCSGASEKGSNAAHQLEQAWGNTDAIRKVANDYLAARDSLSLPGETWMMNDAFFNGCASNDSMLIMAQAIALAATELGKENGSIIVKGLTDGTMDAQGATARLGIIDVTLSILGRSDELPTCYKAIDAEAQSLPEDQQMVVYAHSCSPATLGDALRQDRATDSLAADKRAAIVNTILTGEDLNTFKSHYYK